MPYTIASGFVASFVFDLKSTLNVILGALGFLHPVHVVSPPD